MSNFSNIGKRLFFALWAIPLGWWFVNSKLSLTTLFPVFGHTSIYPGQILAVILTSMGLYEYLAMLGKGYKSNGFWLVYIWFGGQILSYFFPETFSVLKFNISTYILLVIVAFESFLWGRNSSRWKRASLLFSGTIFITIALNSLLDFYVDPFQTVFFVKADKSMLSQLGIVSVLASIFLCDSTAYFTGSFFGRHHFSKISPNKTIEGVIGGLLASSITMGVSWYFLAGEAYPRLLGILLGIAIGLFAQIGDLLVSLMKRNFKVKDASNLIPGHGGILDRFDSLFFTAPIVNLIVLVIVKLFE